MTLVCNDHVEVPGREAARPALGVDRAQRSHNNLALPASATSIQHYGGVVLQVVVEYVFLRLPGQLNAISKEEHALCDTSLEQSLESEGDCQGLAGRGRHLDQEAPTSTLNRLVEGLQAGLLIRPYLLLFTLENHNIWNLD